MMLRGARCLLGVFLALGGAILPYPSAAESAGNGGIVALPTIFYSPETGIGAGGMIMATRRMPDRAEGPALADSIRAGGSFTQKGQFGGWTSLEVFLGSSQARLGLDASLARFPSLYFGLGPEDQVGETYIPFMGSLAACLGLRLSPAVTAGPRFRFAASKTLEKADDGLLANSGRSGIDGYISNGLGFVLTYNSRDSSITPTKGAYLELGCMASPSFFGSSQDFGIASLDLRGYLEPLPSWRTVLALQARGEASIGQTPFQELPRLGGDKLMRGCYDGRFRDNFALAFQAEIRQPLWWRFGLTIFGAGGMVARSPAGFELERVAISGGIGFRIRLDDASKANMRVDVAWAEAGPQCYFNFGEAF